MTPLENLHYAIGELAYAIAYADGKVQPEERKRFHSIVAAQIRAHHHDFDVADIGFQLMERDHMDVPTVYNWAMHEIKTNSHYLSPELKKAFVSILEKIAKSYPPVTISEKNLIDKFKEDIAPLQGDPVFYAPVYK